MNWDWEARYESRAVESELLQGDIVCATGAAVEERFKRSERFLVLTQSCDLARQQRLKGQTILVPRVRTVIIAPVVRMKTFFEAELKRGTKLEKRQRFSQMLWWNGALHAYLPPSPTHRIEDDLVVVLEELYSLELWHLEEGGMPNLSAYDEIARAPRVGLSSPWAERLGWMAGSLFARIGTPDPHSEARVAFEKQIALRLRGEPE